MALSDYAGRSPVGYDEESSISRVSRHYHWNVGDDARRTCAHCDDEIRVAERHVLVTLEDDGSDRSRRYLCDEFCLGEWVG
jgi:hypothetical protein